MSFHTCSCPLHPRSFSFRRFLGSFSYTFRSVHTYSCLSIHIHVCPYIFMSVHSYSCLFIHIHVLYIRVHILFINFTVFSHTYSYPFHTYSWPFIHVRVLWYMFTFFSFMFMSSYTFISFHKYSCPFLTCSCPFQIFLYLLYMLIYSSYIFMAFSYNCGCRLSINASNV